MRHIIAGFLGFILTLFVFFVSLFLHDYLCGNNEYEGMVFNRVEWIDNGDKQFKNERSLMMKDLQRYHLAIGLEREEIITLLGKPDKIDQNKIAYCIGRWNGFLNPSEWLKLKLDEKEVLIDFGIDVKY